jgi:exodeoxyribonuclease VII small subunit
MPAPKSPVTSAPTNESPPSFEQAVGRLADIVQKLERGDLPLEDSLVLFESGVKLARSAQEQLDQAERRVEELLGFDERGEPIVRELEKE